MKGKGVENGVFITTSDFSDSAKKYADNFQIVLVDGIQLTDLMLEYEVGV
ncbi:restriction endonuclease [Lentilactobacillus farraginis]|nr:restriction endonuclease [Lentilactobacillus farraginis]